MMTSRIVMVLKSSRVAASDKLGMRCTGRLIVRPRPLEDSYDYSFEVGAAVDAWWEGVVTGFDVSGSSHLQVYFPGAVSKSQGTAKIRWLPSLSHLKTTKWRQLLNTQRRSKTLMCLNRKSDGVLIFLQVFDNKTWKRHLIELGDYRMDTDNHVFISWKEHVVSQEKGRRVVHYYLKDTSGELILAVVGTERSTSHKLYVVSEDYLDAFGHTSTVNSDTKWRARKEVVEWLTFLISKHHQSPPISDTSRSEKGSSALMAGHISDEVSKNITREDPSTQGPSGSRSVDESSHSGIRKSIPGNQIAKSKPPTYPKLKLKFPSLRPVGIQLVEPQNKLSFKVDDNLEVLCHDNGMRGCWFRCKILQVSQKHLKVQYDDIQDCDAPEKLEEWIPSYRVAASDKLGMRCTGRLTVRPRPLEDSSDYSFEVGAAVDAWWSDGWWEGVVAGFDVCESGHLQVYLPAQ